jgi:hypothetical protein
MATTGRGGDGSSIGSILSPMSAFILRIEAGNTAMNGPRMLKKLRK